MPIACPDKNSKSYKLLTEAVTEEKAHALYDALGGDIPEPMAVQLRNVGYLQLATELQNMSTSEAEHVIREKRGFIYSLELEDRNMDSKVASAIRLIKAKIDTLYNQHIKAGDDAAESKRDLQIATLKQDLKDLKKNETVARVLDVGEKMMGWVINDVVNANNMDSTTLASANHTLDVISNMVTDILDEKTTNAEGEIVYTTLNPVMVERAQLLRTQISNSRDQLGKVVVRILAQVAKAKGTRNINIDDLKAIPEAGIFRALFGQSSEIDSKLVQLASVVMNDMESNAITEVSEKTFKRIEKAQNEMKAAKISDELFNELLLQKDKDGNLTTNIVSKYTPEFDSLLISIRRALRDDSMLVTENSDGSTKKENPIVVLRRMSTVADVIKLAGPYATEATIQEERERLIDEVGEEEADNMIKEAQDLNKKWEKQLSIISDRYMEYFNTKHKDFDTIEKVQAAIQDYKENNSPLAFLDYLDSGNGKTAAGGMKYLSIRPNLDKGAEFYDKNYARMKEMPAMFNLYNVLMETMSESLKYLPMNEVEFLGNNYLPEMDKDLTASMLTEDWSKSGVVLWNKMLKMVSTKKGGEGRFVEDGKGNKIPQIPIRYTEDRVGNLRRTISKLEHKIAKESERYEFNKGLKNKDYQDIIDERRDNAKAELDKLEKRLKTVKEAYTRATANKSLDVVQAVRTFAMMATMYKYRNEVKDVVHLIEKTANELNEQKKDLTGKVEYDEEGKVVPKNTKATNALETLKYSIDAMLYDKAKEDKKATNKLVGTNAEARKAIKEMKEKLEKAKQAMLAGKISIHDYEVIEEYVYDETAKIHGVNNFSYSRVLDNITQAAFFRGMAWNIRSAFGNLVIARVANSIEAASGEFFGQKSFKRASSILNSAVKNSMGLKNEEAIKIANLMHRYGIMFKNLESAYGGAQNTGSAFDKWGLLAPLELQKRGEYYNQGVTLMALLVETKVMTTEGEEISLYDAYDKDGIIKDSIVDKEQWGSLSSALESNKFTKTRMRAAELNRKVHGNYDKPMRAKKTAVGRAFMGFKTWLPAAMIARFGEEYYSDTFAATVKGRYRSYGTLFKVKGFPMALNTIKNIIVNDWMGKVNDPSYTGLKQVDIYNLKRNAREIQIFLALSAFTLLSYLVFADDDDDEETNLAIKVALDMIGRAQSDITLFVNPSALNTAVIAAPPALKYLFDIGKIPSAIMRAINSDDKRYDAAYVAKKFGRILPGFTQGVNIYDTYSKDPYNK